MFFSTWLPSAATAPSTPTPRSTSWARRPTAEQTGDFGSSCRNVYYLM